MRKLWSTALVGLAASAGMAFPTAAQAAPVRLGDRIAVCVDRYEAGLLSASGLNRCIDDAVAALFAADTTVNTADPADGILGSASDGGVNTGILGTACGDGSVNTGILGSAGC